MRQEVHFVIGGTTDGGTTDGGTTDGGATGGRTANSMFAGASQLPPLYSGRRLGWAEAVSSTKTPANFGGVFPPDGWDPLMMAGVIAGRFAAATKWMEACDPGYPEDDAQHYLNDLHERKKPSDGKATPSAKPTIEGARKDAQEALRADLKAIQKQMANLGSPSEPGTPRLAEIQAQQSAFTGDFFRLAGCSAEVRPNTFAVVLVGIQIGALVCSHFKMKYMRQRPAQAWPTIDPAIATPRHPAYPSGHAMQAHLVAELLGQANAGLQAPARALAERIAENREIAGVHYPTDTKASVWSVKKIMELLATFDDPVFQQMVKAAKDEHRFVETLSMENLYANEA